MPHEEQALRALVQHLQFTDLTHKQNIHSSIHDSIAWQLVTSCCRKPECVQWTRMTHSSGTAVWEYDTDRWISTTLRIQKELQWMTIMFCPLLRSSPATTAYAKQSKARHYKDLYERIVT
jgi:hypothetical protein